MILGSKIPYICILVCILKLHLWVWVGQYLTRLGHLEVPSHDLTGGGRTQTQWSRHLFRQTSQHKNSLGSAYGEKADKSRGSWGGSRVRGQKAEAAFRGKGKAGKTKRAGSATGEQPEGNCRRVWHKCWRTIWQRLWVKPGLLNQRE